MCFAISGNSGNFEQVSLKKEKNAPQVIFGLGHNFWSDRSVCASDVAIILDIIYLAFLLSSSSF
jgi:hypothetical protein